MRRLEIGAAFTIAGMGKLLADFVKHHSHVSRQIRSRCKLLCAPALTTFSRILEPKRPFRVLPEGIRGFEDMGALHQLAIALVAAAFSIGLLVTARHFIEYRSARNPAITFIERGHVPL
jgi:hypothetical protein